MPRLFIAIDIPKEIIEYVINIQKILEVSNLFDGIFVKPENLHLTLKFLGEINSDLVSKIRENLRTIIFNSFEIQLSSIGYFSESYIKIIWLGMESIDNNYSLINLQKQIEYCLNWLNKENQNEFVSHLTIARVKSVKDKEKLKKLISEIEVKKINFKISEFILKKSELTQYGAIHSNIEKYLLR